MGGRLLVERGGGQVCGCWVGEGEGRHVSAGRSGVEISDRAKRDGNENTKYVE